MIVRFVPVVPHTAPIVLKFTFESTFDNLINQTGAISGMSMTLTRIFNGEFTAGVVTGVAAGTVNISYTTGL